jgi:Tfp pilus assembly protein PilN
LPQYTWLTEITQTSAPRSAAAVDTLKRVVATDSTASPEKRAAERNRALKARSDSLLATAKDLKFKIVGHTVDIQALTRFMKSLEASPFIQNVQLSRSDLVQAEGKEVTEFTLEAETQSPPAFAIKTVPLVVSAAH